MLKPPFKLASALDAVVDTLSAAPCFPEHTPGDDTPSGGRARLADLDPHLHCSVIGTCLSTGELRKLMARFVFVRDSGDLEVHHEAVRFAGQGGAIAKALHKALDQRHALVHDPPISAACDGRVPVVEPKQWPSPSSMAS